MQLKKIFSEKSILINTFLVFALLSIIYFDFKLFASIILSFFFGEIGFKINNKLNEKFKIPKIISSFLIVGLFGIVILIFFYFLGEIFFIQTRKIFLMLTNQEFISEKIENFHIILDFVTHKIQNFQKNKKIPGVILKEIENLFDLVPKIIYQKINQYSIYLIQKSYIPGLKIINFIYFIILFLIFSFFTMNNWDKIVIMKNKFLGSYSLKIQEQINSFKILISKMLVGQIKVAIILFCFYTFFFWIFKFEYYIVLSLVFAVLTFIPIVGSILSIIILILSFYLLGTESSIIIKLSIVFVIGYLLENLYLTPSLVGSSLNVHPMLILIGLIMFSKFFGILGMSFALPVTAFLTKIINDYLCEIKIHNFK